MFTKILTFYITFPKSIGIKCIYNTIIKITNEV